MSSLGFSVAGGLLIGAAALLLYAGAQRIAGISGIFYGALERPRAEGGWRWLFLLGLIGGGWLATAATAVPAIGAMQNLPTLLVGGLLVGFGTRLGNGCTSGHGVCGVARGSARAWTATIIFMATGVLAASGLRGLLLASAS